MNSKEITQKKYLIQELNGNILVNQFETHDLAQAVKIRVDWEHEFNKSLSLQQYLANKNVKFVIIHRNVPEKQQRRTVVKRA